MFYLMPDYKYGRPILKPTAVNVIREGIHQAKKANAPLEMIRKLESELVLQGLISMFNNQNQNNN